MTKRNHAEEALQKSVVQFLQVAAPDLLWWATSNEGVRAGRKTANGYFSLDGIRRKAMGVLSGVADLQFISEGKAYFIELKAPGGTQSANQRGFEGMVKAEGCDYEVCRSLEEVEDVLVSWGMLKEGVL